MAKKKQYKNITHIPGLIRVTLPNGQVKVFKNSTAALQFFDKNYASLGYHMEISSTTNNKGEITINGGELPEVVVVGKAPTKKEEPAETPTNNSSTSFPFYGYMNTKIGNNREANRIYRDKFYGISDLESLTRTGDASIDPSYWDSETYRNFREGSDLAAAFITAPAAIYGLHSLYTASPYIAGAMNLDAAYHGLSRLTSKDGVQKTWNHLRNGEWGDAALSAGGDVLDVTMSLPFLNRVYQGAKWVGRGATGELLNQGINRFSPYYTSEFNWRTGRFNITPRPGVNVPEGATVKFGVSLGLPSPTLSLPGSVSPEARAVSLSEQPVRPISVGARETPTYGSMNEIDDAIEAGIFPTNEEVATASNVARVGSEPRPIRFYGGEEIEELPIVVNGRPVPPSVLPGGEFNPEYYRAIATHFNRPVEDPNGMAIFPTVATSAPEVPSIGSNPFESGPLNVSAQPFGEDPLPPAPAEVNNVADPGNSSVVEDFDWGHYETETPSLTAPTTPFDDIFSNNGFSREAEGQWTGDWGRSSFELNPDGSFRYSPSVYSNTTTLILPSELEPFLLSLSSNSPFLSGNYSGLDDFMIRAGYMRRGGHRLGRSFGNLWEFSYDHPVGLTIPIRIGDAGTSEAPGMIRLRARGLEPVEIPSEGLSRESLYNHINSYLSNIQERPLTPELISLILSRFPIFETQNGSSTFRLTNSPQSPLLGYNHLNGRAGVEGRGYRSWEGDIADLTPEVLEPIRIPEIITSSTLPLFSAISRGTNWGQVLGIGENYNSLIDFGLGRPRPTYDQVVNALGNVRVESPSNYNANMTVHELGNSPLNDFPYLELPNSIPIIHTNLVPRGGETTLDPTSKRWAATMMSDLGRAAKGVDVASTEMVNPTLSRVVSDISAALNLSELDRYNLLHEVITHPERYFPSDGNGMDYSLFSYPENAVKGNNSRRFFTEPSLNFRTTGFNHIGLSGADAVAEGSARSFIDFLKASGFKGNLYNADDLRLIFKWLEDKAPQFYLTIDNKTYIPFPITTVKKKGGKLVKKKFNINGKKTRK